MSNLGPRTFGRKEELIFLGKESAKKKNYSEATAKDIDKEVLNSSATPTTQPRKLFWRNGPFSKKSPTHFLKKKLLSMKNS